MYLFFVFVFLRQRQLMLQVWSSKLLLQNNMHCTCNRTQKVKRSLARSLGIVFIIYSFVFQVSIQLNRAAFSPVQNRFWRSNPMYYCVLPFYSFRWPLLWVLDIFSTFFQSVGLTFLPLLPVSAKLKGLKSFTADK